MMHFSVPLPQRIAKLPVDKRGYPVPWFVAKDDRGEWDFRMMDGQKLYRAVKERLCWVCGEKLGRYLAFTIGPMCAINRSSGEPPSHRECSEFSAQACPFLTNPEQKRNERKVHGEFVPPGGEMIRRNPGVTMTWICERYTIQQTERGPIFKIGDPTEVIFFREGRKASQREIFDSIESGLPILYDMAQEEGPKAIEALYAAKAKAYDIVRMYAPANEVAALDQTA
jgi:hypothetical protein